MGSVSPLLAIAERAKQDFPNAELFWIGTKDGPEKKLVEKAGISFQSVASGKLRRYFSAQNFLDPFKIIWGFFQSFVAILKIKPDLVLSAGSFVGVPVVFAAWILRKKIIVHHQDIELGLANKLLTPLANRITVSFEDQVKKFPVRKTVFTGNPVRAFIFEGSKQDAQQKFNLEQTVPTLLVLGGGTGADFVNQLFVRIAPDLVKFCQIIHVFGQNKMLAFDKQQIGSHYHAVEFLTDQLADVYAVADLVVTRAGLSSLTELAVLGKPMAIIPIPDTHQEDNSAYFSRVNAALQLDQKTLKQEELLSLIKDLFAHEDKLVRLQENARTLMNVDAVDRYMSVVHDLL